jgi:ketosteroid isomerase-like protein
MALGLALASVNAVQGADTPGIVEQEIRRLDAQEADAVLRGDYALIDELWADDFIVNNPFNSVGFGRTGRVRTGVITYASFERVPEFVGLRGDVAIVMGHEVVVPIAPSVDAGRTLRRRYTNIWMKTGGGWKLSARHANVIAATDSQ